MKCEHCGSDMVWEGSLVSGSLKCSNCKVLDFEEGYAPSDEYVPTPTADIIYEVFGAGGGGGCYGSGSGGASGSNGCGDIQVGAGGGGASSQAQQAADMYASKAKPVICSNCQGYGAYKGGNGFYVFCADCHGSGLVSC